MKKYRVYYTVKMNANHYEYYLDLEAQNAKDAVQQLRTKVFKETGRNAFTPHASKNIEDVPKQFSVEGLPPKKIMEG